MTQVYVNMGKAIAAYERLIMPAPSRFDIYVEALLKDDKTAMKAALTSDEVAGLRLFIDRAQCINCHNVRYLQTMIFTTQACPPQTTCLLMTAPRNRRKKCTQR